MLDGKRTKLTRKITRPKGLTHPRHHRGVLRPSRPIIATKPQRKNLQDSQVFGLVPPEPLDRRLRAADIYDHFINGLKPVELSALERALRGIDTRRRAVAPTSRRQAARREGP